MSDISELPIEQKATNSETMEHIIQVQGFLSRCSLQLSADGLDLTSYRQRYLIHLCIADLASRGLVHDQSKLRSPEVEIFTEFTPKLESSTYGSPEYEQYREDMGPALDHHYKMNRHHPEHFNAGIGEMNLLDIIEMLCDWKAATLRHADGDIRTSIQTNQERFEIADSLSGTLFHTLPIIEDPGNYVRNEKTPTLIDLLLMVIGWRAEFPGLAPIAVMSRSYDEETFIHPQLFTIFGQTLTYLHDLSK